MSETWISIGGWFAVGFICLMAAVLLGILGAAFLGGRQPGRIARTWRTLVWIGSNTPAIITHVRTVQKWKKEAARLAAQQQTPAAVLHGQRPHHRYCASVLDLDGECDCR